MSKYKKKVEKRTRLEAGSGPGNGKHKHLTRLNEKLAKRRKAFDSSTRKDSTRKDSTRRPGSMNPRKQG